MNAIPGRAPTPWSRRVVARRLWFVGAVALATTVPASCARETKKLIVLKPTPAATEIPAGNKDSDRLAAEEEARRKLIVEQDAQAMKVALQLGLGTFDVKWAPARRLFALAPVNDDRTTLLIYSDDGQQLSNFPVDGELSELSWLDDTRVAYKFKPRKPAPRKRRRRGRRAATPTAPWWIIQPVRPGADAVPLKGERYIFAPRQNHIAWIGKDRKGEYVGVDGDIVYPREGRTAIQGTPAFSDDGLALAFVELPPRKRPRLVLLAAFDNPTGDVTWPLESDARDPAMRVFWAGRNRLVVGPDLTKPVFSTTFETELPAP